MLPLLHAFLSFPSTVLRSGRRSAGKPSCSWPHLRAWPAWSSWSCSTPSGPGQLHWNIFQWTIWNVEKIGIPSVHIPITILSNSYIIDFVFWTVPVSSAYCWRNEINQSSNKSTQRFIHHSLVDRWRLFLQQVPRGTLPKPDFVRRGPQVVKPREAPLAAVIMKLFGNCPILWALELATRALKGKTCQTSLGENATWQTSALATF